MIDVMIESMREFQRAFGRAARDGQVIELDGVVACLTPGLPAHSLFNACVYEWAADLRAALPELARAYEAAGVRKWAAWAHESDSEATAALQEYGMVLDSEPASMGRPLAPGDFEPDGGIERTEDLAAFDRIEALAWDFPVGVFAEAMPNTLQEFNCYLAREGNGTPAAIVGTLHHRGDCGVTLVATTPEARGQGLATRAMRHALAEAARDGCTTTTLQASAMGRPIYERMGYADFGRMQLWELHAA